MPRIEVQTSLRRLGARTYVHSTQIFGEFLQAARRLDPQGTPLGSLRIFKFLRETARNGRCVIAPAGEIDAKAAASTIAYEAPAGEMLFAFFDDGAEVSAGGPDLSPAIARVEAAADFAGRVHLKNTGSAQQLFVDLVEANKALHNATLLRSPGAAPPAYRFVYAESLPASGAPGRDLELIFTARESRQRGGRTYTLNEVRIASEPDRVPIRICFAF